MNKKKNIVFPILTPILITVLCGAIVMLALIVPFNKLKVYLNIAFMDELQTTPGSSGLVITDNDIITDYSGETYEDGEITIPSFGEQYAVLSCESAGINVPVYWGSTTELLEKGACQSSSSSVLGEKGNTVIDAHVDTYFENLESIAVGDEIILYTNYGEFTYTVKETVSFMKTDKTYILPKDDYCLTLYTCKKQILGSSDARVGVVCTLKEKAFYNEKQEEAE